MSDRSMGVLQEADEERKRRRENPDDWPQIKARLEQDAEECENGNEYVIDGEKQTKAFAADIRAALRRESEQAQDARNLLARIHRDGGHHTESVGFKQSCLDAEQEWLALRQRVSELERDVQKETENAIDEATRAMDYAQRAEAAEAKLASQTEENGRLQIDCDELRRAVDGLTGTMARVMEALHALVGDPHTYECGHGVRLTEECDEPDCQMLPMRRVLAAAKGE